MLFLSPGCSVWAITVVACAGAGISLTQDIGLRLVMCVVLSAIGQVRPVR
ncbi:hypothetical protein [Sodalis sp. RH23]